MRYVHAMTRWVAPLVGRSAELNQVERAIRDDSTVGIVLAGPAGVGKTRLANESLSVAERHGVVTERVHATRAAASVRFGALAPLLADAPTRQVAGPDLFSALTETIHRRAGNRPFLLCVDDAHRLGEPSAALIHQASTSGAALVVMTIRTGERHPDAISALWNDDRTITIDVRPLDRVETAALVSGLLDGPVDETVKREIWEHSAGNPLFTRELVAGSVEAGALRQRDGRWHLVQPLRPSARLDDLIGERLDGLDPRHLETLDVIAIGDPLELDALSESNDADSIDVLDRSGLITVDSSASPFTIRPAHPLIGDVVRARMSPLRRMKVSRELYEGARGRAGVMNRDPVRVALWALDAGGTDDQNLLLLAARRARESHEYEVAARLARAARDLDATNLEAIQLLGEVLSLLGHHDEALEVLTTAQAREEDDRLATLLATTRADLLFWGMDRPEDALGVLEGVDPTVGATEWRDEMTGQRATFRLLQGRPLEALELTTPILERSSGRPFAQAAMAAAPALAVIGRCDEALAIADAGFAEHAAVGNAEMFDDLGIHLVSRCLALVEAGRLIEAEQEALDAYEAAFDEDVIHGRAWFALLMGRALWLRRPPEAIDWFKRAEAAYATLGHDGPRRWCLAGAASCEALLGHPEVASELFATSDGLGGRSIRMMEADITRCRATLAVAEGLEDDAVEVLDQAVDLAEVSGARTQESAALHDLVRLGRPDRAAPRLVELAAEIDGDLADVRADHATALCQADGSALEQVAEKFLSLGATVLAAEAAGHAADAFRRSGSGRVAARQMQRCRQLSEQAGGLSTPAVHGASAAATLTKRERQLVRFAAAGRSNQQIAEELSVSLRTVENHLYRAYVKLGVSGRSELAGVLDTI